MRDCVPSSFAIGGKDGISVKETRCSVDEDHGDAGQHLAAQVRLVVPGGDDDQAIDAAPDHGARHLALTHRILVQAGCQHGDAAICGSVADGAMHRRREGIGNVLEHEPDRFGLATAAAQM